MEIVRIKSITEYHRLRGLPKPEHPLISLVDYSQLHLPENIEEVNIVMDFYSIALKRDVGTKLYFTICKHCRRISTNFETSLKMSITLRSDVSLLIYLAYLAFVF